MRTDRIVALAGLAMLATWGCTDVSGPADGRANVSIGFETIGSAGTEATMSMGAASLAIEGTNGTLVLEEVHMIVAEFELKVEDDDDCPSGALHEPCEKFDAGPSFVNLSLEPGGTTAVAQSVDAGVYDELEFEVEDLDDGEEGALEGARTRELRTRILTQFPDWPRDASMLVSGTFTPRNGSPQAFRTYLEAEIEIELDFVPPLVVEDGGDQEVTVEVDPEMWFRQGDGTVLDLSSFDYGRTGRILEFEFEVERGFSSLRVRD